MPRSLSAALKGQLFAQQSGEAAIPMLTLEHPTFSGIVRVCANNETVYHQGEAFVPFPFDMLIPDEHDEGPPQVTLQIDNVDRTIIAELRAVPPRSIPIRVRLFVVTASAPDTVEVGPYEFDLRDASGDAQVIKGTLRYEDLLNQRWPADAFTPAHFTALG